MATKIGDMAVYISANTAGLARDLSKRPATIKAFCVRFCAAARAEPEKKKGFLSGLFGKD